MFRWSGSKELAEQQAADRQQRGARRYLRSLPNLDTTTESFQDCDSDDVGQVGNLDGNDSLSESSSDTGSQNETMAPPTPFDREDKPDDENAWKKSVDIVFQKHDVEFWFAELEAQMKKFGINSQWSKRTALLTKGILPDEVIEELKPLFRLSETDAGNKIYHDIKTELLEIYGQKDEDACEKASKMTLTTRPSALGKQLIHAICPGAKPFANCHCARVVWWFFIKQMPQVVKTALAKERFNKDTYTAIFKHADDVYASNRDLPAVVAAVSLDETQPAIPYPVEAATFKPARGGRGGGARGGSSRGGRGGRGGSQPSVPTSNSTEKSEKDKNLPPNLCSIHKKFQKEAYHCRNPFVCPYAKFIKSRPSKD